MKKTNFLNKLHNEGKLKLVEPSEEIKESYLKKSESHLSSAKILLQNSRLEEAVSMAYYSMYYTLTALLYKTGIKCENHTATIIILKEIFNTDNEKIAFAKKERIDKQYYVDFQITKKEVKELINATEEFNTTLLNKIARINREYIHKHREKLKNLLKK